MSDTKQTNPKDAIAGSKVPLWLLSPIAKAHWSLAQFVGMVKYGAWNWRTTGVRASVYLSAIERHRDAFLSGEDYCPIDGMHHLGAIMAGCALIMEAQAAGKLVDDRPPRVALSSTHAYVMSQMDKVRALYADKSPKHYTIEDSEDAK